jgi:multicomponent Na+:H+ antiporter subunit D
MILNLVGTVLLLIAVGLVYGATGFVNFDAVSRAAGTLPPNILIPTLGALLLAVLVKAGAFPLFSWLPASYHTLPAPLLALAAALLTKVGVYALYRILGDVFVPAPPVLLEAVGWIGCATMLVGAMGAMVQQDLRRVVAWLVISAVGFLLMGIAAATPGAQAATLVYLVHDMLIKAGIVFAGALVVHEAGSWDLRSMGGLWACRPWLSVLFLVLALSLMGIPPLSGFWAKLVLLRALLDAGRFAWVAVALLASLLTIYAVVRVWMEACWKDQPGHTGALPASRGTLLAWAPALTVAGLTVAIGLMPEPLVRYALDAAATLTLAGQP